MGDLFYPEFVPNQILTDTQLNQLRDYLEREDRLTRTRLIGIGVACGFTFRAQTAVPRLVLQGGVGISSDGYLIAACAETVYTHHVAYDDPDRDAENRIEYEAWRRPADATQMRDIRRLVSEAEMAGADPPAGAIALDAAMLGAASPWLLALYLEREPVELNSCLVTACDNKGQNVNLNLRVLLVAKADAAAIAAVATAPVALRVPRLHTVQALASIDGAAELNSAYEDIVLEVLPSLRSALASAFARYRDALDLPAPDFADLTEPLLDDVDQYRYDALKDLVQAHNEAVTAACALAAACCPTGDFPRHLLLGAIDGTPGRRHEFAPAGARDGASGERERVRRLFLRIDSMLRRWSPATALEEVRIVPSHAETHPLGSRALPWYYDYAAADMQALWQPRLPCTTARLWSYRSWTDGTREDLDYDDYVRATWLRIEGHVGRPCDEVEQTLRNLRRDHNAEFDHLRTWFQDPSAEAEARLRQLWTALAERHTLWPELRERVGKGEDGWQGPFEAALEADRKALSLDQEWRELRRLRPLHCEVGALEADYAALRSALLCILGQLDAAARRLRVAATALPAKDGSIPAEYAGGVRELLVSALCGWMLAQRSSVPAAADTIEEALGLIRSGSSAERLRAALWLWLDAIVAHAQKVRDALVELQDLDLALLTARIRELAREALSVDLAWRELVDVNALGDTRLKDPPPAPPELRAAAEALVLAGRTCLLAQIAAVHAQYQAVRAADTSLFANLATHYPGLEHLAGVGKGGTFVTVCETQAGESAVAADFALSGRVACCCRRATPCVDPFAAPDVCAVRVELDESGEGEPGPIATTIEVLANDFDPNAPDGLPRPAAVQLMDARSDLGAELTLNADGVVGYRLERPVPGALDRFAYTVEHVGKQCHTTAIGEVLVFLWHARSAAPAPTRSVTGTVWINDKPASAGVRVRLDRDSRLFSDTNAAGQYAFATVAIGQHIVQAFYDDLGTSPEVTVEVKDRDVVVDLHIAVEIAAGTGALDVRVRARDGAPIAGVNVFVTPESQPDVQRAAVTDNAGRARLVELPAGRATVLAQALGFQPVSASVAIVAGGAAQAELVLVPFAFAVVPAVVEGIAGDRSLSMVEATDIATRVLGSRSERYADMLAQTTLPAADVSSYAAASAFIARMADADVDEAVALRDYRKVSTQLARAAGDRTQPGAKAYDDALAAVTFALADHLVARGGKTPDAGAVTEMNQLAAVAGLDTATLRQGWQGAELQQELSIAIEDEMWKPRPRSARRPGSAARKRKS